MSGAVSELFSFFVEAFTDWGIKEIEKRRGYGVSKDEREKVREGISTAIKNNAELQTALLDFIDECIDTGAIEIK
jgi:hypothetical protein